MTLLLLAQAADADSPALRSFSEIALTDFVRALILLAVGIPCIYIASRYLANLVGKKNSAQAAFLTRKITLYAGWVLLVVSVMTTLHINLTAILGAAGIGAVAIGIAAQSSLSNLISGLFLIVEKPFSVGDTIRVGDTVGTVVSVDLLSVKLTTPDNLFVRIPNENLVKAECTTISRNAVRRLDIKVGIAYKENIARVLGILKEVAAANPLALKTPEALVTATDYGDSAVNLLVGVWCARDNYVPLRNALMHDIKERLTQEGIEIPFPYLTLTVADGQKFPVKLENQG